MLCLYFLHTAKPRHWEEGEQSGGRELGRGSLLAHRWKIVILLVLVIVRLLVFLIKLKLKLMTHALVVVVGGNHYMTKMLKVDDFTIRPMLEVVNL